ncbi:MAG: hypothetical protein A2V67_13270 [Deltaproteobacteria bacterium RBG_13_61_14]|nr:MAG: hypothetical protein A2V67_13270 [Deltaproteobacteria bacterium RBG_13_61_14]
MDLKRALGRKIRSFRKARKLSQEKLAEMASLSITFLGTTERGWSIPSLKTCLRLAKALRVPLCELFRFDEMSEQDYRIEEFVLRLHESDSERLKMILEIGEVLLGKVPEKEEPSPSLEASSIPREKAKDLKSGPRRTRRNRPHLSRQKLPGPLP